MQAGKYISTYKQSRKRIRLRVCISKFFWRHAKTKRYLVVYIIIGYALYCLSKDIYRCCLLTRDIFNFFFLYSLFFLFFLLFLDSFSLDLLLLYIHIFSSGLHTEIRNNTSGSHHETNRRIRVAYLLGSANVNRSTERNRVFIDVFLLF